MSSVYRVRDSSFSSQLDKQILPLDLHQPGTHGPLGWSAEDGAGSHVELAAVAGASDRRAIQLALRERARPVGTCVIEGMQMSARIRNVHLGSLDIEDAHLTRDDILRITNSYQHDLTSELKWNCALLNPHGKVGRPTLRQTLQIDFKYSTKSFFSCSVKLSFLKLL
ncbi:MAG: hypothetical protein ACREBG_15265 [Pyrinomonadaceae bacterium]